MSRLLDEVALDLHDAYAMKDIKALTLRYDGDTVVVICKDTRLAVSLMQMALDELQTPRGKRSNEYRDGGRHGLYGYQE